MTIFLLLLAIAVSTWALWAFNRLIDGDGLGHREPPRSHHDEYDPRPSERWAHATR